MKKHKILWVDDEATGKYKESAADLLFQDDFEVDIRLDVSKAISALEKKEYDLVIMDLRLPPGKESTPWRDLFFEMERAYFLNNVAMADPKLGLRILQAAFLDFSFIKALDRTLEAKIVPGLRRSLAQNCNLNPDKYAVLTVEPPSEVLYILERIGINVANYLPKKDLENGGIVKFVRKLLK